MISRRVTLAALASAALGPGCRPPPPSLPSSLWGAEAPALQHRAIDGRIVDGAALRGRIVVVEFFASYCEPCKRTLPALQRLHRRGRGLAVIAVGEDESPAKTRAMAASFGLTMPVIHDAGNVLAGRFRVDGLPSAFVVDTRGVVRWVGGGAEAGELRRVIAAVRSER